MAGAGALLLPYAAEDLGPDGIPCLVYNFKGESWGSLYEHTLWQHDFTTGHLEGALLKERGRQDLAARDRLAYQRAKGRAAKAKAAPEPAPTADPPAPLTPPPAVPPAGLRVDIPEWTATKTEEDGTVWRSVWLRVGADGKAHWPLELASGPASPPAQGQVPPATARRGVRPWP